MNDSEWAPHYNHASSVIVFLYKYITDRIRERGEIHGNPAGRRVSTNIKKKFFFFALIKKNIYRHTGRMCVDEGSHVELKCGAP